ncbi:MAG: DUF1800 family protein [Planctomycetota bacterium]|jgi:uncharacterized protein (DUF1800 family)
MRVWRYFLASIAGGAMLLLPACGGGGGGSAGQLVLALQSITVSSQPAGPESPFGTTQGGDTVHLHGLAFANGLTVTIGTQPAGVQQVSSTEVVVSSPPGPEGFAVVTVTNPTGESSSLTSTFQYIMPPTALSLVALTGPTINENRAPIAGNETIQVNGSDFKPNATIDVGGSGVATTFVDPTRLTFLAPSVPNEAAVDVLVRNPEGLTSTLTRALIYTQEFSLERAGNGLTQARASHLYRRAGFGAPPPVINQAVADGLFATVARLVDYTNDPTVENEALALYGVRIPPDANINNRTNQQYWIHLMLKNPNPFQDRLAFFLHDNFATSGRNFNFDFTWTLNVQVKLLRRFSMAASDALATGEPGLAYDWERMCAEIAKDRAMLDWLDGRVSRVGNPNENFARELWELFMLGEGRGYTETDIQEAARAFTGFLWFRTGATGDDELDILYRPARHDTSEKTILGATGRFGYDSVSPFLEGNPSAETDAADTDGGVVALTLRQRPVEASTFICRKLWEFFVYEDPHDVVVDALAAQLRTAGPNQWNLKPILIKMLESKAMYSSRAVKGKVKSPVEFLMGFLRSTEIDLHPTRIDLNTRRIYDRLVTMGQVLLDPPDVNGWPAGLSWMAAQSQVERFNLLNFAVEQLDDVPTQIDPLLPPRSSITPTSLVDHIAGILDVQLSGNARNQAIAYVTSQLVGGSVVPFAFDPNNDEHIKNKSRGLIYMIGQYHDAHQD